MLNSVILLGRLTRNPELKTTPSGKEVVTFNLAVNRNKDTADFITCVAWENMAKFMNQYLKQGSLIVVQGSLQTRSYDRKDGSKAMATEVIVSNIEFGESKPKEKAPEQEPNFDEVDVNGDLPF